MASLINLLATPSALPRRSLPASGWEKGRLVRLNSVPARILAVDDHSDADRPGSAPAGFIASFYTHEEDVKEVVKQLLWLNALFMPIWSLSDFTLRF